MQNLKRNSLFSSNWHAEFDEFWPRALKNLKDLYFNGLLLTKVYNVWTKKRYRAAVCGYWRFMRNLKKTDLCFLKWHEQFGKFSFSGWKIPISFYKVKWQNWKSETTRSTRYSVKTLFYLWNKWIVQLTKDFYSCSTESLFLKYKKVSKKAVKLVSFLQCSVSIFPWHNGCIWKIYLRILWNHIIRSLK